LSKPRCRGDEERGVTHHSRILTENELISMCRRLLSEYKQPVLVEAFLPGRELTVGILGTGRDSAVIGGYGDYPTG